MSSTAVLAVLWALLPTKADLIVRGRPLFVSDLPGQLRPAVFYSGEDVAPRATALCRCHRVSKDRCQRWVTQLEALLPLAEQALALVSLLCVGLTLAAAR